MEEMSKYGVECKCNHEEMVKDMEKKSSLLNDAKSISTKCLSCGKTVKAEKPKENETE